MEKEKIPAKNYRDLIVWQNAIKLAIDSPRLAINLEIDQDVPQRLTWCSYSFSSPGRAGPTSFVCEISGMQRKNDPYKTQKCCGGRSLPQHFFSFIIS